MPRWVHRFTLAAGLLIGSLTATTAQAATITVNTTTDAAPNVSQCSGAPGDCALRQAINKAAAGDTVVVPSGSYALTGALGQLAVTRSLIIAGAGARSTTINASGLVPRNRVLEVTSGSGPVTIAGVTLTGGLSAAFQSGGGLLVTSGAVALLATRVADNVAGDFGNGGGLGMASGATALAVIDSTISGNKSGPFGKGGGIARLGGTLTVLNSTISGNQIGDFGAGGGIDGGGTLVNATINGNSTGPFGTGGNLQGAGFSLKNTIVAGGTISGGTANNCSAAVDSQGHNLENLNTCGLNKPTDKPTTPPQLGALADIGGQTDTHALLPGSQAIHGADNAACPPTDQRGIPRPQGPFCDIGAFEVDLGERPAPPAPPDRCPTIPGSQQEPCPPPAPAGAAASALGSPADGLKNCTATVTVGRDRTVKLCDATNPPTASTSQALTGTLPARYAEVARKKRKRKKPKPGPLATGQTTIPAGQTVPVTVRLTAKAAKALKKKGSLKVKATIEARGVDGQTATVTPTVNLKAAKKAKRRKKR